MKLRKTFAKNLRRIREEKDISQEKLAELADLDRTYIGRIELKNANVSLEVVEKLSQALNVSPLELLK